MPITDIRCKLTGVNSNAHSLMGEVKRQLIKGGRADLVDEFIKEATSSDYKHLLETCHKYVEVY